MYFRSNNLIPPPTPHEKYPPKIPSSVVWGHLQTKKRRQMFLTSGAQLQYYCHTWLSQHFLFFFFCACKTQIRESRTRAWFCAVVREKERPSCVGVRGSASYSAQFFRGVSCSSRERRDHLTHEKFMLIELWHKQAPQKERRAGEGALHHRLQQQQLVWFSWKTNSPGLADACPRASS